MCYRVFFLIPEIDLGIVLAKNSFYFSIETKNYPSTIYGIIHLTSHYFFMPSLSYTGVFFGGSVVKYLPAMQELQEMLPGSGRYLEEAMATASSILPWRIP